MFSSSLKRNLGEMVKSCGSGNSVIVYSALKNHISHFRRTRKVLSYPKAKYLWRTWFRRLSACSFRWYHPICPPPRISWDNEQKAVNPVQLRHAQSDFHENIFIWKGSKSSPRRWRYVGSKSLRNAPFLLLIKSNLAQIILPNFEILEKN